MDVTLIFISPCSGYVIINLWLIAEAFFFPLPIQVVTAIQDFMSS